MDVPAAGKRRRVQKDVPVWVFEDHDTALDAIHRAIGAKSLAFEGATVVHLDAHPDLLSPEGLQAADIFEAEVVRDAVCIASWMLPLVYAGHVSKIIWVKPPWCGQFPDGRHELGVGRHKGTGELRVHTTMPYFLNELIAAPKADLAGCRTCQLHVHTVDPATSAGDDASSLPALLRADLAGCVPGATVFDVCLDFYSVHNPFRAEMGAAFAPLRRMCAAHDAAEAHGDDDIAAKTAARRTFVTWLHEFFHGRGYQAGAGGSAPGTGGQRGCGCCSDQAWGGMLAPLCQALRDLQAARPAEPLDPERLNDVARTVDLPHHESTEAEVEALLGATRQMLGCLAQPPSLVTVARSVDDGYTPSVSSCQRLEARVLKIVGEVCPHIAVHRPDD